MRRAAILLVLCLLALPAPGEPPGRGDFERAVDRAELGQFWGVVVVRVGGRTVVSRGYGFRDEGLEPIDPETSLFDVGSIAKSFTVAAVLRLVDRGEVTLDTSLGELFEGAGEEAGAITLRQLMNHTSGIGRGVRLGTLREREDLIRAVSSAGLDGEPGARFAYSNVGYFVLAAVVERVAGESFEEAMRRLVFEPAGLERTGFVGDGLVEGAHPTARRSRGREGSLFAYPWNWGQRGATGVVTTGADLARWVEALRAGAFLSGPSREAMFTPGAGGYGLGWHIETVEGRTRRIHHPGATGGYRSSLLHIPAEDATVVVLTNERCDAAALARDLGRLVAPDPERPTVAGVYLLRYPDQDGDGVVTVDEGLTWEVMPAYRGSSPDGKAIVDERPTVVLKDAPNRMWSLIVRMDRDKAARLAKELLAAIRTVAEQEGADSTPWAGGLTATFDANGLTPGEYRNIDLSPGSRLGVDTDGLAVVLTLVDGETGVVAATIRMGGAETTRLVRGLRRVAE